MSVLPRKLLILVLSAMLWLPASLRADAQLSRHPYLQTATPESINVVWRTVGGTIPILRYAHFVKQQKECELNDATNT